MAGQRVAVVGGANSAGQAALQLARFASHVTILVRGSSLEAGMSDYLVQEIRATPNIDVCLNTTVVDGRGRSRREAVTVENIVTREGAGLAAAAADAGVGQGGVTQCPDHEPEEESFDGGTLAGAGPGEFTGEGVDAGFDFGRVGQGDGAGCAEERVEILVALEQMVKVAVGDGDDPATGVAVPGKAVDDPGGDEQQAGRFEVDAFAVCAHRSAAFGDQDDMVEVAVEMRLDRPLAGAGAVVQAFNMDEALRNAALRLSVKIEAGDGSGHGRVR